MYNIILDKVIKLTPAKALAHIIQNKITKEEYGNTIRIAKQHNANMYPPYQKAMDYRDEYCMPPLQIRADGKEIICSMQDLLNHDIKKLLKVKPHLKSRIETIRNLTPGAAFRLIGKWGMYIIS